MTLIQWICRNPSPYNSQLFNELSGAKNIELKVHYLEKASDAHPWREKVADGHNFRTCKFQIGFDWHLLSLVCAKKKLPSSVFIIGGWDPGFATFLCVILSLRKAPYFIWTDTPNPEPRGRSIRNLCRSYILKYIFNTCSGVLGTGRPSLNLLEKMGVPRKKIHNFPYWINQNLYARSNDYVGVDLRDEIKIIACGRIQNDTKGHDVLVHAFSKVRTRTEKKLTLMIVGDGPDRRKIKQLINKLGLSENIFLPGWSENDQIVKYMQDSDIFVHPSVSHEPYGVVVLEAMASGLPVLASDKTYAALDRIVHNWSGLIHAAGDVSELESHLTCLINNSNLRKEMALRSKITAQNWRIEKAPSVLQRIIEKHVCAKV